MNRSSRKLISIEDLRAIRDDFESSAGTIGWTNGCFDILHAGHVLYLQRAAEAADILVVGVNSDESVRSIKGPERPIVCEEQRLILISALECVDYVVPFGDKDCVRLLSELKPDCYIKGGDYSLDTINQDERRLVEGYGGEIRLIPAVTNLSTTLLIDMIKKT